VAFPETLHDLHLLRAGHMTQALVSVDYPDTCRQTRSRQHLDDEDMIKPCKPVHRPQRLSLCLRIVETAPLEGFGSTNAEAVTDDLQLTTPRRPDEPGRTPAATRSVRPASEAQAAM
jgi:hypothetical protein